MSDFDPNSREAYYAAGILRWSTASRNESFFPGDLADWYDGSDYDTDSSSYFSDGDLVLTALGLLVELGAVERHIDRYGPTVFAVKGSSSHRLALEYPQSPFARDKKFGVRWTKEALKSVSKNDENQGIEPRAIIADYDQWTPLLLDRENPDYNQALTELSASIRQIAEDNGFAATMPDERDNLVLHAEATIESLKNGKTTKQQLRSNIIGAGKWLAEKFGGSALAALGTELVKWGLRLIQMIQ